MAHCVPEGFLGVLFQYKSVYLETWFKYILYPPLQTYFVFQMSLPVKIKATPGNLHRGENSPFVIRWTYRIHHVDPLYELFHKGFIQTK